VGDVALNLSGLVRGSFRAAGGGSTDQFAGRGAVSPIGKVRVQGTIVVGSGTARGQFRLNFGRKGAITAAITGQTPGGGYTYQITGGTKAFVNDSGSGVAAVQILSLNATMTSGRFALNLIRSSAE
jgi:hypothetical protein